MASRRPAHISARVRESTRSGYLGLDAARLTDLRRNVLSLIESTLHRRRNGKKGSPGRTKRHLSRKSAGAANESNTVSQDCPESYAVEPRTGVIYRTVQTSNGAKVTTIVGKWDRTIGCKSIRAMADAVNLRAARTPHIVSDGRTVRVADLFSGCGAMSLGLAEACRALGWGFEAAAAFDIDPRAIAVYAKNFNLKGKRAEASDISAILCNRATRKKLTQAEKRTKRRVGRVDFLVAGPPCQGNSDLNNKTRRRDPRNELYYRVARFARIFTPKWILVENVTAVQHDKGKVVARTREALETLGYEVTEGIVNMLDIGVPQTRRRHLLVAVRRKGNGKINRSLDDVATMVAKYRVRPRTVTWAIRDLRNDQWGPKLLIDTPARATEVTQRRIDWLFDQKEYDLPDSLRPDCHSRKPHTYKAVYGRIRPGKPAPTITGGFETMGRGRFVNPWRRRTLTAHEAARLQCIPDWFDFSPAIISRVSLAEIIGNAVPPKLSYVVALELMR